MILNSFLVSFQWHGKGTLTFSTGELYVGEFEHGLMSGNGEMEYKKNMKYKGEWLNNLVSSNEDSSREELV